MNKPIPASADLRLEFLRQTRRHRAGGQPARLGVADQATRANAEVEADFRQLRRLARAGFAANDDHLVVGDQFGNIGTAFIDRQVGLEFRLRQLGPPFLHRRAGTLDQCRQIGLQFLLLFAAGPEQFALQAAQALQITAQAMDFRRIGAARGFSGLGIT